jgi:hypothetical protein
MTYNLEWMEYLFLLVPQINTTGQLPCWFAQNKSYLNGKFNCASKNLNKK